MLPGARLLPHENQASKVQLWSHQFETLHFVSSDLCILRFYTIIIVKNYCPESRRTPKKPQEEYSVLFEDTSYSDGFSPPLTVPQRYVIMFKEGNKKK